MPPRPLASGTISFGLVSIPIRLYPAAVPRHVSFHLLHARCGNRIKYQAYCPHCEQVVERDQLVKGFEIERDRHVKMPAAELEALEAEASKDIDIAEFVPLASVDPVYLDEAYFLGPDKGGAKPYHLLAETLRQAKRVGIAQFVMRGKESLVLIRPGGPGLVLHTLYYHDEIRDAREIDRGTAVKPRDSERRLALRLVEELSHDEFRPEKYKDEYRARVLQVVKRKAKGKAVAIGAPRAPRGKVIDLMEALRQSLARKETRGRRRDGLAWRPGGEPEAKGDAMKAKSKGQKKVGKVMREYEQGSLRSSSGAKVRKRKQAVAIALSEARQAGARIPKKRKQGAA